MKIAVWVLCLLVLVPVVLSDSSNEKAKKPWYDEDWCQWFPQECDSKDSSLTNIVPDSNHNSLDKNDKKEKDFSTDKTLSYKDDLESFVEDDDKKSYLKNEEKSEKDWHAEFEKSRQLEDIHEENEIAEKETEDAEEDDDDDEEEEDKSVLMPEEETNSEVNEKNIDKVPSGYSSFDSILPQQLPKEEIGDDKTKETVPDGYPVYNTKHESVKKDLKSPPSYPEFTNTKPDLKTSPNPPPPGLNDGKPLMVTPAVKKAQSKDDLNVKKIHITSYIKSYPSAFCTNDNDCKAGRMCHDGACVCLPDDACIKHTHEVCGSDGVWYPSHCELHRMACIHRQHIKIDRTKSCLKTHQDIPSYKVNPSPIAHSTVDAPLDPQVPSNAIIDSKEIYVGDYKKKEHLKDDLKEESKPKVETKMAKADKPHTCDYEAYQKFKENLLVHHCNKFAEPNCNLEVLKSKDREYIATLMFSYYDRDIDYYLERSELDEMERKEELVIMDTICTLLHMLIYDDQQPKDDKISVTEFLKAFDKNDDKGEIEIEIQIVSTLATVGNGLELKCAILGESDITWTRFNTEITDSTHGLMVFDDGSLFFNQVGVDHIGNYTCSSRSAKHMKQVHVLDVQMPPIVTVSPVSQLRQSNSDITVKCKAEGLPEPEIFWQINEMPLPDDPKHFEQKDKNETLTIHNADYHRDTGAYKCIAKNQAGSDEDVASIFIRDMSDYKYHSSAQKSYGTFIVFHSRGYTAYRPQTCLMRREVRGKFGVFKFIPDNLSSPLTLCDDVCDWGTSVNVKDKYVFVSQPSKNRVVVIDTSDKWNPVQVIDTDHQPVALYYIEHLDQVWVVCWNDYDDGSMKTIVVIRDASEDLQHHSVHTQPIGNRFDLIEDIFMPPANDLRHHFNFGYVVHTNQRGLFKLDLNEMKYVHVIDFTHFDCIPKSLAFVPIGGHVIVECVVPSTHKTLQIVLDYITDAIISHLPIAGEPFVTPDSKHIATVDYKSGKVAVSTINNKGKIEMGFEVIVSTNISDVEFFPSTTRRGYDLVMSSVNTEDIIILSLNNGKVEKIKGTHKIGGEVSLLPTHSTRTVVNGGSFSEYFMMPFDNTISIVDGKHHRVKCEFKGVLQSKGIVFVQN